MRRLKERIPYFLFLPLPLAMAIECEYLAEFDWLASLGKAAAAAE